MAIPSLPKIPGMPGTKQLKLPKPVLKRKLTTRGLSRQAGELSKSIITNHISNMVQAGKIKMPKISKVKPL